jgi:hypothetical protein
MKSLNQMLQQISGMVGTDNLTAWEQEFVQSCLERTKDGADMRMISGRQAEIIERIFNKHFAG